MLAKVIYPVLSLVIVIGCQETTVVECEDQFGNPINCPDNSAQARRGTATTTGGDGSAADGSDASESQSGNGGTSDSDGSSAADGASGGSCVGYCGSWLGEDAECHCDSECTDNGDCCNDYESVCGEDAQAGGTDGVDGADNQTSQIEAYAFPSPFETALLSYDDCRGIASGNSSYCESYDCRAIVKRDKGPCTTPDCKGIASASYSWCASAQCKGISRGYKCLDDFATCSDVASGSSETAACEDQLGACQIEASGYCNGHKACKAIVRQDASWCGSNDGNCKAISRGNASYCFYGDR